VAFDLSSAHLPDKLIMPTTRTTTTTTTSKPCYQNYWHTDPSVTVKNASSIVGYKKVTVGRYA